MTDTRDLFHMDQPPHWEKVQDGEQLTPWEQIEYDEWHLMRREGIGTLVGRRVRYGVNPTLEEAADELIYGQLRGITSREEKSDVLTPWKIKNRIGHEVYNASGYPDPSIRQGMFNRVLNRANPNLNSRDGLARAAARSEHTIALRLHTGTDSGPADG
jgi:hypothetical protein